MKSKNDITIQIQRINAKFNSHRLYNKALSIAMLYNHRMSKSEYNNRAHGLYMKCLAKRKETMAQRLLEYMGSHKYLRSEYIV